MDPEEIRYQVLRAINQEQRQRPNDFVNDDQIAEITRLDLQTVRDEMDLLETEGYTQAANSHSGKSAMLNARSRKLLQELAAQRARPPRARDVEQWILEFLLRYEESGGSSVLAGSGVYVGDTTIAEELRLRIQLIQDCLENLARRGCVDRMEFISGPYTLVAALTGLGRTIAREPDYAPPSVAQITNISTGGGAYIATSGGDVAQGNMDKRQAALMIEGGVSVSSVISPRPIPSAWSPGMDFVDWCGVVLYRLIEASQADERVRQYGMREWEWAQQLFSAEQMQQPDFHGSPAHRGFLDAIGALEQVGLVESRTNGTLYKVTRLGRARAKDMAPLWVEISGEELETEQQEVLQVVNRTAMHIGPNYVQLTEVMGDDLLPTLGWPDGFDRLVRIAQELKQLHLVKATIGAGYIRIYPMYSGLVWETRRG